MGKYEAEHHKPGHLNRVFWVQKVEYCKGTPLTSSENASATLVGFHSLSLPTHLLEFSEEPSASAHRLPPVLLAE